MTISKIFYLKAFTELYPFWSGFFETKSIFMLSIHLLTYTDWCWHIHLHNANVSFLIWIFWNLVDIYAVNNSIFISIKYAKTNQRALFLVAIFRTNLSWTHTFIYRSINQLSEFQNLYFCIIIQKVEITKQSEKNPEIQSIGNKASRWPHKIKLKDKVISQYFEFLCFFSYKLKIIR